MINDIDFENPHLNSPVKYDSNTSSISLRPNGSLSMSTTKSNTNFP